MEFALKESPVHTSEMLSTCLICCHSSSAYDRYTPELRLNNYNYITHCDMLYSEVETPINFCPSRFSLPPECKSAQKTCLDFLGSNANLNSKSRHTVQICVLEERKIWTHLRKSRRTEIIGCFHLS